MFLYAELQEVSLELFEDVRNLYHTTYVEEFSNLRIFGRANPSMLLNSWIPGSLDSHMLEQSRRDLLYFSYSKMSELFVSFNFFYEFKYMTVYLNKGAMRRD